MTNSTKMILSIELLVVTLLTILYKTLFSSSLASRHTDAQSGVPLLLLTAAGFFFMMSYFVKRIRFFKGGFLLYFFGFITIAAFVCFIIGITTPCPVCSSEFF